MRCLPKTAHFQNFSKIKKGGFMGKGHPNYNHGKTVSAEDFVNAFNAVQQRKLSKNKAAKQLGVSLPTFNKWDYEAIVNGYSIEGLTFIKENLTDRG
jgi:hypothetical protein